MLQQARRPPTRTANAASITDVDMRALFLMRLCWFRLCARFGRFGHDFVDFGARSLVSTRTRGLRRAIVHFGVIWSTSAQVRSFSPVFVDFTKFSELGGRSPISAGFGQLQYASAELCGLSPYSAGVHRSSPYAPTFIEKTLASQPFRRGVPGSLMGATVDTMISLEEESQLMTIEIEGNARISV